MCLQKGNKQIIVLILCEIYIFYVLNNVLSFLPMQGDLERRYKSLCLIKYQIQLLCNQNTNNNQKKRDFMQIHQDSYFEMSVHYYSQLIQKDEGDKICTLQSSTTY